MMNKLKFFYAACHFCQIKGLCLSANNAAGEIPVCEECSRKLIIGVTTALNELSRMNEEEKNGMVNPGVEVPMEEVAAPEAEVVPEEVPEEVPEVVPEAEPESVPEAANA